VFLVKVFSCQYNHPSYKLQRLQFRNF
jgi:hypothetical protein